MATTKRQSGRRQPTPPERKASEKTMDPLPGLAVAESPQPKIVETTTEATPETELAQQAATSNSVTKASAPIIPQELAAKIRVSRKRVKDAAIALIAERVAYGNYLIEVRKLKFPHGTWTLSRTSSVSRRRKRGGQRTSPRTL